MKSLCTSQCRVGAIVIISLAAWAQQAHPILAIGSSAPNFELPGIDGAIHKLSDYSASRVRVVVFTCNHRPVAQMYERRIAHLTADYSDRGVSVVAIEPNDPKRSLSTSSILRTSAIASRR